MAKRRVVVTGLGMLTPLGNDVESTWQGLLNGKSGIQTITHFDTSSFGTKFAGLLNDFDASAYMPAKDAKKMDLFILTFRYESLGNEGISKRSYR